MSDLKDENRKHVERVVTEAYRAEMAIRGHLSSGSQARDAEIFVGDISRRVADRLSAPVLSEEDACHLESARRYLMASCGLSAFPDFADAARAYPHPAAWVILLDRLIAARKP